MKNRENVHNSRFLTVQQVAKQLLEEAKSVRRWLKIGKGYKLTGGDWRIRADDVEEILMVRPRMLLMRSLVKYAIYSGPCQGRRVGEELGE